MFKKIFLSLSLSLLPLASMDAASLLSPEEESFELRVNNRVLAQVNGKPITVIDVMKRMDMIFYRQYPQYVGSKPAQFQFYQASWKTVLENLIDNELVKADAVEMKVEVTSSEVRQELETNFGPNIISNLDSIDMTLDEAEKILKDELLIRKMMTYKVNGKAFRTIGPQQIREAYEKWSVENKEPEKWQYQVVTIRDSDASAGNVVSRRVARLLKDKGVPLNELKAKLEAEKSLFASTNLTVSEEFNHAVEEISEKYKEALITLSPGEFSDPISQISRADSSTVYRIFHLVGKKEESAPTLAEMENRIRNMLLSEAIDKEGKTYTAYLRSHFSVSNEEFQNIKPDFEPFALVTKGQ